MGMLLKIINLQGHWIVSKSNNFQQLPSFLGHTFSHGVLTISNIESKQNRYHREEPYHSISEVVR